jgi:hypothetical protein
MSRNEDDPLRRRKTGGDDVNFITRRCVSEGWLLGLRLVKQRKRSPTRPADQNDLLVAELLARMAHPGSEIDQNLFHDQGTVIFRIAAGRANYVQSGICQRLRHGQQLQGRTRMHEDVDGVRAARARPEQLPFEIHSTCAAGKSICFAELRDVGKREDQRDSIPPSVIGQCHCCSR